MCVLFVCHVCRACPTKITKPSLFIRWSLVHRWKMQHPRPVFSEVSSCVEAAPESTSLCGEWRACLPVLWWRNDYQGGTAPIWYSEPWMTSTTCYLFVWLFEFWVAFALWPFQSFSQAWDDFGTSTFGSEFKSAKLHPQTGAPDVKMTSSLQQSRLEKAWRTAIHYSGPGLLHGAGTPAWFLEASKSLDELGFETCSKLIAYFFHFFVSKVGVALVREYCWLGG